MIYHSSIEPIYYVLPLIGLIIGLFGTMLGGGGGFFFLPVLTLIVGVPVQTGVVTSLVATLPICLVGTHGHYRRGNVDGQIWRLFAVAGIIGAVLGAVLSSAFSSIQLKIGFGIYSVVIAVHVFYDTWRNSHFNSIKQNVQPSYTLRSLKGGFFGFFAGTVTGTFGTSGTAPVLAGLLNMRMPIKLVIGTSLTVVLVNTLFAVGAHMLLGKIDLTLVYFLTSGSIIGAFLGPVLLSKLKTEKTDSKFRYVYAVVMIAIGILMIKG